jgi:hypothetical protein
VTYAEGPALVADHGFTTGHIDQTSFEKLLSPSAMKIGVDHGMGCYIEPGRVKPYETGIIDQRIWGEAEIHEHIASFCTAPRLGMLTIVCSQEAGEAAKMIVMTMTEHEGTPISFRKMNARKQSFQISSAMKSLWHSILGDAD